MLTFRVLNMRTPRLRRVSLPRDTQVGGAGIGGRSLGSVEPARHPDFTDSQE